MKRSSSFYWNRYSDIYHKHFHPKREIVEKFRTAWHWLLNCQGMSTRLCWSGDWRRIHLWSECISDMHLTTTLKTWFIDQNVDQHKGSNWVVFHCDRSNARCCEITGRFKYQRLYDIAGTRCQNLKKNLPYDERPVVVFLATHLKETVQLAKFKFRKEGIKLVTRPTDRMGTNNEVTI